MPDKRIPELDPLVSVNGTIMIPGYDPVTDTTYRINLSDVNPGLSTVNNSWQPAPAVYNEDDIVQSEDRLWASNIDGNTDVPPYEGVEWREISRSKSGLTLYMPGTFMDADVYVVSNYTGSYNLYRLINPTRPFESVDLEAEVTGGDWEAFGSGGGGSYTASNGLTLVASDFQLGGILTGEVYFDGDSGTGSVYFDSLSEFSVAASSSVYMESFDAITLAGKSLEGGNWIATISIMAPSSDTIQDPCFRIDTILPIEYNNITYDALLLRQHYGGSQLGSAGNGQRIAFTMNNDAGVDSERVGIRYNFTDVTADNEEGEYTFELNSGGGAIDILKINGIGAEYTADFSAFFTDLSLVNKKYVDDAIAAAL